MHKLEIYFRRMKDAGKILLTMILRSLRRMILSRLLDGVDITLQYDCLRKNSSKNLHYNLGYGEKYSAMKNIYCVWLCLYFEQDILALYRR